jgi:hypothetical protein
MDTDCIGQTLMDVQETKSISLRFGILAKLRKYFPGISPAKKLSSWRMKTHITLPGGRFRICFQPPDARV